MNNHNRSDSQVDRPIGPFLRWAGSKRRLIPRLIPFAVSTKGKYIEPFMGSASLFFALKPREAVLSDLNSDLVNVYVTLKEYPRKVHSALSTIPLGKRSYYQQRSTSPDELDPIQRSARFLFLNRFCFNGLYRTNALGQFNVPYSPAGTGDLPSLDELLEYSKRLKNVELLSGDFEGVVKSRVREGDFVYMDPPYSVSDRRVFREYGPKQFGVEDLLRLKTLLDFIDGKGATFLLSYAYSRDAMRSFSEWASFKVFVRRNISGFADRRRRAAELVFTNSKCFTMQKLKDGI